MKYGCQSPIEEMLVDALHWYLQETNDQTVKVETQYPVLEYWVDIMIVSAKDGRPLLAIECDGHEFHEKTKEQAARDKRRDREIIGEWEIPVLRYTGSEIYKDAVGCAEECISSANSQSYLLACTRAFEKAGYPTEIEGPSFA